MVVLEKKTVGVVVAIYNEEEPLPHLISAFQELFLKEKQYDFQVYFVENGSLDKSAQIIENACAKDARFSMIQLSRNFRMDGALTAGLHYLSEDSCVLMAGDMQDPPSQISIFLRKWEDGYENVYGVVTKRNGVGLLRRFNSKLFYLLASKLTDGRIPKNASDFRLVDKKVYAAIREMDERNRFVRGLFAWAGFKSIGVPMERPLRAGGSSNASTLKTIDLALKGIFAHSIYPLRMITWFGFFIFFGALLSLVVEILQWLSSGVPFAGYGLIITILLLGFGFTTVILGIIAEYIGLIYEETKNRPNFIVSRLLQVEQLGG